MRGPGTGVLIVALLCLSPAACTTQSTKPDSVPVIFDTDIGEDIDDVWALVMLLKSADLDVRLITTSWGKADSRARSVARLLELAGRSDIPIALGRGGNEDGEHLMQGWIEDYSLEAYRGRVDADGVQAVIDAIESSEEPVTYITVGPPDTLAAAIRRRPSIASKMHYVGMLGSIRRGYDGSPQPSAEWNARADVKATREVLSADWRSVTLAPTDTAGLVTIGGDRYRRLAASEDPLLEALLENYRLWRANRGWPQDIEHSSTLFDTVAVYLARPVAADLVKMEAVRLSVTDRGFTREHAAHGDRGHALRAALAWEDLNAYRDLLVETLTGDVAGAVSFQ